MMPSERLLDEAMARFVRGEDPAFDDVYRYAGPWVRGSLRRMCRSLAWAEDLAQETFLRVSLARGQFDEGARALPWILTIARNTFLDFTRRAAVRDRTVVEAAPAIGRVASRDTHGDDLLLARELFAVVCSALDRVAVRQREAFLLLRVDGLTASQAARLLGTTEAAVKLRAQRAYGALREAIDEYASGGIERSAAVSMRTTSGRSPNCSRLPRRLAGAEPAWRSGV